MDLTRENAKRVLRERHSFTEREKFLFEAGEKTMLLAMHYEHQATKNNRKFWLMVLANLVLIILFWV